MKSWFIHKNDFRRVRTECDWRCYGSTCPSFNLSGLKRQMVTKKQRGFHPGSPTVFAKDKTDDIRGVRVGVDIVGTSKVDCIVLYCIVLYYVPSLENWQ